ncbi:MAG: DUF2480 family protein [Candidatus Methylacidiphilales bacterium]
MDLADIDLIENKVANSGLITIDLETLRHAGKRVLFDIKDWLFREMILKEKDFRDFVKNHDWSQYQNQNIAFYCSTDAIVPTWAYMLLASAVQPYANKYVFGNLEQLEIALYTDAIEQLNPADFADKRIILKGCSQNELPIAAYVAMSNKLLPVVKSLMYGEACSNVPIYKKR